MINNNLIKKIIKKFSEKKVCIIGDIMLDHYIYGDSVRMSPEAPVPVVVAQREEFAIGGAGNLAHNIVTLGARPFLISIVGDDEAGRNVQEQMQQSKIDSANIIVYSNKPTIQKTRIIVKNRHLARLDREVRDDISHDVENILIQRLDTAIKDADIVVVSDYAKGLITKRLAHAILTSVKHHHRFLLVDTKPENFSFFKGAYVITPNKSEAEGILGHAITTANSAIIAGKSLQRLSQSNILMKLGPDGVILFEGKIASRFPSIAQTVVDVVGAGDTVVAVLALALASKATLKIAAELANIAGGIAVQKQGTATVRASELIRSI